MEGFMRTNTDLTLYKKSVVSGDEVYTRQVIEAVFWENRKAVNVIKSGLLDADAVTVYIPFARGEITIKPGDVLVKGAVTDEISSSFTITKLMAKYADTVRVTKVDTMDYGSAHMQHWQVGAK
jgi:hypothetical protein